VCAMEGRTAVAQCLTILTPGKTQRQEDHSLTSTYLCGIIENKAVCYSKTLSAAGITMEHGATPSFLAERRSEPRKLLDRYYSVEFAFNEQGPVYQFKLRNVSSTGLCILVRENSAVMRQLQVGDVLDMRYCSPENPVPTQAIKTRIRHITQDEEGRFKDHFLVGLSVVEGHKQESPGGGNGSAAHKEH